MIDSAKPFKAGDRVEWIQGSRLTGFRGTITDSGCVWSFVKLDSSAREEYTKTALLRLIQH